MLQISDSVQLLVQIRELWSVFLFVLIRKLLELNAATGHDGHLSGSLRIGIPYIILDICLILFALSNLVLYAFELLFQIIYFMLLFIDDLLVFVNVSFEKYILLSVDEVLKLPCLSDGIGRFFEPQLIGLEVSLHFFLGDIDGFQD